MKRIATSPHACQPILTKNPCSISTHGLLPHTYVLTAIAFSATRKAFDLELAYTACCILAHSVKGWVDGGRATTNLA
jgi:hypothetical protein